MHATRDLNQGNRDNNVLRSWERLVNLKHITFYAADDARPKHHNLFFSRLSMLRNIEKIQCHCHPKQIATLKVIMQQCGENIIVFDVEIDQYSKFPNQVLPPLKLPNAQHITMHDKYFYAIWTNKCDKLKINHQINEKWCQHVINQCDCSGVKHLTFDNFATDALDCKKLIFKEFSQQFINLTSLNINIVNFYNSSFGILSTFREYLRIADDCGTGNGLPLLLQLFAPTIKKNSGDIYLAIGDFEKDLLSSDFQRICDMIESVDYNYNFITRVWVEPNIYDPSFANHTRKLIQLCHKQLKTIKIVLSRMNYIKQDVNTKWKKLIDDMASWLVNDNDNDYNQSKLESISLASIKVIDIRCELNFECLIVNELLATDRVIDILSENNVFFNVMQDYLIDGQSVLDFSTKASSIAKFQQFCDIIKLILTKQIAANIFILFYAEYEHIKFETQVYRKIYQTYLVIVIKMAKY